ncbi:MAG: hypothetical protein IJ859_01455 [Synergistaceae bacterium]|nr:hypothetical protein [Synergistaceae bacterium]MBR2207454.1 hypothetical protein [Synergistaceae bacterium]
MIFLELTQEEKEKKDGLLTDVVNIDNLDIKTFDSKTYEVFVREVEERQKIYFESNINSLVKIIKESLPKILEILDITQKNFKDKTFRDALFKLTNIPFRGIEISGYNFTFTDKAKSSGEFREEIFNAYSYQINLVKEKFPEYYEEIIKFINDTLAKNNFKYERHGVLQSELYKLTPRRKKNKELDPILDIMKIKEKKFLLFFSNFSKIKWLRQSALQLLDIIVINFTENGAKETEVSITLKTYMEMRGLKNKKEARKQITEDLEALYNLKFEKFTQLIHGKSEDFINLAIIGTHGIDNGKILASLDGVFSKLLSYYSAIPIHKGVLKLKANKNPCAYYFAKKIHEHKFMNSGKKNEDIIAVMTLLKAAQNVLPTYEEVFNSDRHYERIIDPFERDMEALIEIEMLNEWIYCHKNEVPLTDTELENLDYETFKTLNVKVQWTEYPDQSNRLEIKTKKIKAAIKKKENQKQKTKDN